MCSDRIISCAAFDIFTNWKIQMAKAPTTSPQRKTKYSAKFKFSQFEFGTSAPLIFPAG